MTWSVELRGAAQVAKDGVTVQSFPPGTIFSIGLHPLRSGLPGGGRGGIRSVQVSAANASFARQALRQRRGRDVARPGCAAAADGSVVAVRRARERYSTWRELGDAAASFSARQFTTTVIVLSPPSLNALSSRKRPPSAAAA